MICKNHLIKWMMLCAAVASHARHGNDESRKQAWRESLVEVRENGKRFHRKKGELVAIYPDGLAASNARNLHRSPVAGTLADAVGYDAVLLHFNEDSRDFEKAKSDALRSGAISVEPNLVFKQSKASMEQVIERNRDRMRKWAKGDAKVNRSSSPVDIAIFDTGLDGDLPEIQASLGDGTDAITGNAPDLSKQDPVGHGTQVASLILATAEGSQVNAAKSVRLHSVRVLDQDGHGTLASVLQGLAWANGQKLDLVNMSFSGTETSPALQKALRKLQAKGAVVVASAGNEYSSDPTYPASMDGVLSVGSTNPDGTVESHSNWGSWVKVSPVAANWEVQTRGGELLPFAGTSASAAFVTGLMANAMLEGKTATQAKALVQESVVKIGNANNPVGADPNLLLEDVFLDKVQGVATAKIVANRFDVKAAPSENGQVTWGLVNAGKGLYSGGKAKLVVTLDQTSKSIDLGAVPQLAANQSFTGKMPVRFQALVNELFPGKTTNSKLELRLELDGQGLVAEPRTALVYATDEPKLEFAYLSIAPQRFDEKRQDRTVRVKVRNVGRSDIQNLSFRPFYWHGVHEAVWASDTTTVGADVRLPLLRVGEEKVVEIAAPLMDSLPPKFTFDLAYSAKGLEESHLRQEHLNFGKGFRMNYSQQLHRDIVAQAVKLLDKVGQLPPDLKRTDVDYVGASRSSWLHVSTLGVGKYSLPKPAAQQVIARDAKDWTDQVFTDLAELSINPSLSDGAHDCDEYDVVYGYTGSDTWDTHFWLVDDNDDHGLSSSGTAHHGTLGKIKALLNGEAGTLLPHGAIWHYKNGYKKGAWYLLGHALHLMGDLSLGSHTNDENKHGAYGDPYHDWMDAGNFAGFNNVQTSILDKGQSFISPYVSDAGEDKVRFLAYATAQVGNSFPRYYTTGSSHDGAGGNRLAAGASPHYDTYMTSIYNAMPSRPLGKQDISKNEVTNTWGNCSFDDVIWPSTSEDCNNDSVIDIDNTDMDDNGIPLNTDQDLTRIGQTCYPYAIRAAAGLLYYFAKETGQYNARTMIPIQQLLLD